jgi:site-specific recombinase XerD
LRYPPDPPTIEEIIAVMRTAGDSANGARLRALIVILWRAGLRIGEALDLAETDLDRGRGAVLVRSGKGGRRREVGMDRCVVPARAVGGAPARAPRRSAAVRHPRLHRRPHWEQSAARKQLRRAATTAGVRRRFAPHQLRHAHAVEMAHEGVPLLVIQRRLGHANLGITSIYLHGIDTSEIIDTVHSRLAPVVSATAGLRTQP